MRSISFIALALLLHASSSSQASASTSPKRGLVYTPNAKYPQDDQIWDSPSSAITWYYNYGATPSRTYLGSSNKFEFVPQLWGRPSTSSNSGQNDTGFLNSVSGQIKTGTTNITHVLGFNEPDMSSYGGSGIAPSDAAQIWMQQIEPLARLGVELGSPACSSAPSGISWMQDFLAACKNCTIDFMAVHFYGNFEGLASHVGQYVGTFNKTVWVTEFAYAHADLADSQSFFNQSISFLDRNPWVLPFPSRQLSTRNSTADFLLVMSHAIHISVPSGAMCRTWEPMRRF